MNRNSAYLMTTLIHMAQELPFQLCIKYDAFLCYTDFQISRVCDSMMISICWASLHLSLVVNLCFLDLFIIEVFFPKTTAFSTNRFLMFELLEHIECWKN